MNLSFDFLHLKQSQRLEIGSVRELVTSHPTQRAQHMVSLMERLMMRREETDKMHATRPVHVKRRTMS